MWTIIRYVIISGALTRYATGSVGSFRDLIIVFSMCSVVGLITASFC